MGALHRVRPRAIDPRSTSPSGFAGQSSRRCGTTVRCGVSMKLTKLLGLACVAVVGVTTVARLSATEQDKTPAAYFLEQMPADVKAPSYLPADAKDVIVAKVRLGQGLDVVWLGGRHCEGCTNDIFGARLKIVEVLSGSAQVGEIFDVLLGQRSEHREFMAFPNTPDQLRREYTVVIYLGADGKRRLVPFQITQPEYKKWDEERWAYQRLRGKPGFRN
jgi:hypothetical protein